MKIGLFLALLVLLASTNVFGQETTRRPRSRKPESNRPSSDDETVEKKPSKTTIDITNDGAANGPSKTTVSIQNDGEQPGKTTVMHTETGSKTGEEGKGRPTFSEHPRDEQESEKPRTKPEGKPGKDVVHGDGDIVETKPGKDVESGDRDSGRTKPGKDVESGDRDSGRNKPRKDVESGDGDIVRNKPTGISQTHGKLDDDVVPPFTSKNRVHVTGRISFVKYRSSAVDTVQYDLDGGRLINGGRPTFEPIVQFAQDFLARQSRITLYVSTSKTVDPKLAFAQFPIDYKENHFPVEFDLDVDLPFQQRGFLERADVTLYFFVYIRNPETRMDTFVPAGTSQILLQGTNRLVQRLNVFVRADGIEISGLFRGRFGNLYVRPGTSFQVLVLPEESLNFRRSPTFESVAQLTLTNVPAMFPVPFSLLVQRQMLKPNTEYYAIAYIFENGVRREIKQDPILVITKQTLPLSGDVIFNVVPASLILEGSVTRAMPNLFALQPNSRLVIRLRDVKSNSHEIKFTMSNIVSLPVDFSINVTQSALFDQSADYEIRAFITDGDNKLYMGSSQSIPLLDQSSKLIIPVDDYLYYVRVRLHSSSSFTLNYMRGSVAQVFVTESPDAPTKPIVAVRFEVSPDFREFSIQVPTTAIERDRSYYLVMMIENHGVITHVSKTLLISNNQPPPLIIQLPVLSLNLLTGTIIDSDNINEAQWSSSSYASLYLIDDSAEDAKKAVVQVWKIHLEKSFPIRFEVQVDFSRIRSDRAYRLEASIDNGRGGVEYKPVLSAIAIRPDRGLLNDVRVTVRNVKTYQLISGLIYIDGIRGELPEHGEVIVQLSSKSSLANPDIIDTLRIKVDGRKLPIDFEMKLSLKEHNLNDVYYFLVQYVVRDTIIVPISQAFAFSPRNQATVVITLSKTPQIPITGQITSTGSALELPVGTTVHLYVTDNFNREKPMIYSEVFLKATLSSLYEFTMNIDSLTVQRKTPLYLRADIIYNGVVILSMPRPALLQITPGGEWNINLVVDLPTLVVGQITTVNRQEKMNGEFDVFIQVFESGTTNIVHTVRLRLATSFPQEFRIQIDNSFFARHKSLEMKAVIKNCKGQTLFESGGSVSIKTGINVEINLPVVLTDRKKFNEIQETIDEIAPVHIGEWHLSVVGTNANADGRLGELAWTNSASLQEP